MVEWSESLEHLSPGHLGYISLIFLSYKAYVFDLYIGLSSIHASNAIN